ncbi:hypothetical protein BDF19DRAFT_445895 [Syncephalis fuscata]|nr:hypothetical protein BDF19DRAFT_445895 [Syncephalis fuscata]
MTPFLFHHRLRRRRQSETSRQWLIVMSSICLIDVVVSCCIPKTQMYLHHGERHYEALSRGKLVVITPMSKLTSYLKYPTSKLVYTILSRLFITYLCYLSFKYNIYYFQI